MQGNEYQKLAMRTNDYKGMERVCTFADENGNATTGGLLNGALGLTGESGEVADIIKKGIFHEKGIDTEHLKKECGDVLWYLAMICESAGFTLDDVMEENVNKLIARYPDRFDTYRANNRKEGDI